jgi:hypothetical protein
MATRFAKRVDAAKTMGRGRPERWVFLTTRPLLYGFDGEPAPLGCLKRSTLHDEVDR